MWSTRNHPAPENDPYLIALSVGRSKTVTGCPGNNILVKNTNQAIPFFRRPTTPVRYYSVYEQPLHSIKKIKTKPQPSPSMDEAPSGCLCANKPLNRKQAIAASLSVW